MPDLSLITDETRYRGWTRAGFHTLLIIGIFCLIFSAYIPWFLYPATAVDIPLKTYAGPILRDALSVIIQYYILVFLFKNYGRRPAILIPGLVFYYIILFTFYYYASLVVKQYFGLPDDYSGSIGHFEHLSYWDALLHPASFFHLMFIVERAFYPLALRLLVEIYRRQVRAAKLEKQYAQLELDFLRSQVNPHFLFNVLNGIYSLTEEDNPRAAHMVQQLSGMMRYALYETAEPFVPLSKELDFIKDYVELEQLRAGKRLSLKVRLPDIIDESLTAAPFILITFVENAFKHGVQSSAKASWVSLDISLQENHLTMRIENSKSSAPQSTAGGLGIINTRKRLSCLYPDHILDIGDDADKFKYCFFSRAKKEMKIKRPIRPILCCNPLKPRR